MKEKGIHYIDEGKGRVVVLIHAFPLSYAMWRPQITALSKNFRVLAFDLRGHGESDVGTGHYTIDFFVDDLMSLLNHLKIEKARLCGLSMGGYVALRALELHPDRFEALVLCDTRSEADTNEAKIKRSAALKVIQEKGVPVFAEEFLKPAFAPETFTSSPTVVQTVREMILKNAALGISGALLALASRTDMTASLKKINIPTLILVGEHDQITPPALSIALKEQIPHAQMHVISKAGHLSNLENPKEFNLRLESFLMHRAD